MNIEENIDREKLEKHLFALFLVKAVMDKQAQPVVITDTTATAVTFSLRISINEQQLNRLIIAPIRDLLTGLYSVSINSANRTLRITRTNKALQIDDSRKVK